MNIEQLRHFSEIARCGSINQATDTLYITQPSLSASIRKLENELGEKVFVRTNNGVTLTPFGEELLPYVRNVIGLIDQLPDKKFNEKSRTRQRLSVCSGGFKFMSAVVGRVYNAHKEQGIQIDYFDVPREESLSMVAAGTAQVGGFAMWDFQKQYRMRILKERGLKYVPLSTNLPTVSVGKNNPLFYRKEDWVTLDMLSDYPLLYTFSEHSSALYNKLGITQRKNIINCRSRAGRGELLSTTDCVSLGAYIAPAYLKTDYYPDRRVLYLKDVHYTSETGYIIQESAEPSGIAKEFITYLHELFEE
ncbi:MAG: LysR family transcriptional regulator [Clostridia bacterium]|nr:LysR family transcriptional regulator [Clostridia bacterium]